jgi:hypothetical protein
MNEESLKNLGITNEDLMHDWIAIREVSCDTEGFEYPSSEDDEDDDDDNDDDYNGDDGHYDEDNPNIPEANPSSLLAKYLWRKLKNANRAVSALTASLERVNITDQKISADDSARDTTLSNNHDEAVATVNTSVFDDTPIPMNNFLEDHEPLDIDSVTLVRLIAATSNASSTTNVPSDNTIPNKREWFASSGKDESCNPAPKMRQRFGRSGLSLKSAGWKSENSLLSLDFLIRSDDFAGVVDAVRAESDDISISDAIIKELIDNLDYDEDNQLIAPSTTKKKKKKKATRVIDFSTAAEPTEDDILFGRGGDINKHPGNVRFREKARELASLYEACGDSKEEKYDLSVKLVDCMKSENRRFLEKGPDGLWYEVLGNGIRKKASQALREKPRKITKSVSLS